MVTIEVLNTIAVIGNGIVRCEREAVRRMIESCTPLFPVSFENNDLITAREAVARLGGRIVDDGLTNPVLRAIDLLPSADRLNDWHYEKASS